MASDLWSFDPPSKETFDRLWSDALIVVDTNVLLAPYKLEISSRDDVLKTLAKVQDKLWIPHQVMLEFRRNRAGLLFKRQTETLRLIRETIANVETLLAVVALKAADRKAAARFSSAIGHLADDEQTIVEMLESDDVRRRIDVLFDGRVGESPDPEQLAALHAESQRRYGEQIPPGYLDGKKDSDRAAGDFLVWDQTIEHARAQQRDVIFVTADGKEDWWWVEHGQRLGPRRELRIEFHSRTEGRAFWAYSLDGFLRAAVENIDLDVEEASIDEVEELETSTSQAVGDQPSLDAILQVLRRDDEFHRQARRMAEIGEVVKSNPAFADTARKLAEVGALLRNDPALLNDFGGLESDVFSRFNVPLSSELLAKVDQIRWLETGRRPAAWDAISRASERTPEQAWLEQAGKRTPEQAWLEQAGKRTPEQAWLEPAGKRTLEQDAIDQEGKRPEIRPTEQD